MFRQYAEILIETYYNEGELSTRAIRAHPLKGQGLPSAMHVQFGVRIRESEPVGSILKIKVGIKENKGQWHVYSHNNWPYEVLSPFEAKDYILTYGEDLQEWAARHLPTSRP